MKARKMTKMNRRTVGLKRKNLTKIKLWFKNKKKKRSEKRNRRKECRCSWEKAMVIIRWVLLLELSFRSKRISQEL
jgi:hypothetical protein